MANGADPLALRDRLFQKVRDIDLCGVASLAAPASPQLHDAAVALLPGARAILVLGIEVFPEVLRLVAPAKVLGEAAARDLYGPHVDFLSGCLNRALYTLARVLRADGYATLPLPSQGTPTDARFQRGILSFKHAAEAAGLGRIGHSSLLITKPFGPRVRLACLLTDAPLPPTAPGEGADPCATCAGDCITACPAGALAAPENGEPYVINKYACASFRAGAGACSSCMSECRFA